MFGGLDMTHVNIGADELRGGGDEKADKSKVIKNEHDRIQI